MLLKQMADSDSKPVIVWFITVVRSNGELEVLSESFDDHDKAKTEALRFVDIWKGVRLTIMPARLLVQDLEAVGGPLGKPMPLEVAMGVAES